MARQQPTIEGLLSNLTTSVVAARAENVQQHLLDQLITMRIITIARAARSGQRKRRY